MTFHLYELDFQGNNSFTHFYLCFSCRKPGGQCSYVSHHYKSQCSQVYNYHRLLSWNKERGLHMDIYKVKNQDSVTATETCKTEEGKLSHRLKQLV